MKGKPNQRKLVFGHFNQLMVCNIPLLSRRTRLKQPAGQARLATIGYLLIYVVYHYSRANKILKCSILILLNKIFLLLLNFCILSAFANELIAILRC